MNGLKEINTSYIIIESNRIDAIMSFLYAKEYKILQIQGYFEGVFDDAIIAYGKTDNDDLRRDSLFILDSFHCDSAVIKYIGESDIKKVYKDGTETLLEAILYNTDSNFKTYIYEGLSFSFTNKTRYWKPTKKEDFKVGMIVEYLSNNKWYEKIVKNPTDEWEKMYKLMSKYEKLRVPQI